ncbi:hypothetical protein K0M31_020038 [Melipona bicolor]|uniref:Uncharacterized protein n=1 Tax=Melipona bicolor TaxID=60889 RepID=A0AA40G0U9_9HYME|nr:hypothetical protein K0M31_020038 [Melipona bicolor]
MPQKYSSAIKTGAICQNVGMMAVRVADTEGNDVQEAREAASTDRKHGKNSRNEGEEERTARERERKEGSYKEERPGTEDKEDFLQSGM